MFSNSFASTKFDIIENFRKIDNLSFDFKQVIEDNTDPYIWLVLEYI